jgi:peptide chain release factor 2/peptide chain release factor
MKHWILQISAGAGPVEVREFVGQLSGEMAARCERLGIGIASLSAHGDEHAPSSVEIEVIGEAPALLADFIGTHVLVAKSGRRGRNSRKRWFAGVSLHASSEPSSALVEIAASEVEITASRAGGPGGQHVNTTDSAVRVRHKGSGVTVRVASERSQHQNRRRALSRLRSILTQRNVQKNNARTRDLRLSHYQFERGSAVQQWAPHDSGITLKEL